MKTGMYSKWIRNNKNNLIFIALLLLVSVFYGFPKILSSRPCSIHQWRQTDCLSITMNYYMEDRNFLEPAIHWQGEDRNGQTVGECPLLYFTVAKLWKVFGYHEFIYRLLNTLLVFLGLYCLFRIMLDILKDGFWAIGITLLMFSSPIFVYYTNNFTTDAPALGLVLIGFLLMWRSYRDKKKLLFYLAFLFFAVAGLIKISVLLSVFVVFVIHLYLIAFKKDDNFWFHKWYSLIPYFIVVLIVTIWVKYTIVYNQKHLGSIFLADIRPFWVLGKADIKYVWHCILNNHISGLIGRKAFCIILAVFVSSFFFYKKANKFLFFFTLLMYLGSVAFILLFYQSFTVHDYYFIVLMLIIPLPVLTMVELFNRNYNLPRVKTILKIMFGCLLFLSVWKTAVVNRLKYTKTDPVIKTNFILSKDYVELWSFINWDYDLHKRAYETITPYLRQIGIKRTDKVLSLPDESPNISLYLMDQKGFSSFGFGDKNIDEKMRMFKRNGVEYLIVDTAYYNKEKELQFYVQNKLGNYKNIDVYKLK